MKTEEEKARELYPNMTFNGKEIKDRNSEEQREAFLKGYEYANQQLKVEMFSIYDVVKIVNNWSMIPGIDEDDIRNYLKRVLHKK